MSLESQLFEDIRKERELELERAALIASGVDSEEKIAEYKAKIDELGRKFKAYNFFRGHDKEWTACSLNSFIWSKKGRKYKEEKFRINEVIDALLKGEDEIGNCVGLTCLYTILGLRNLLDLSVISVPHHMYSRAGFGNTFADIENTWNNGYGIKLKPNAQEACIKDIISTMFIWRGYEIERTHKEKASEFYKMAYKLSPNNIDALVAIAGQFKDAWLIQPAIEAYTKAIQISPAYALPYAERANLAIFDTKSALKDINRAIELEPLNPEYFGIKGDIYWAAGQHKKARKQYSRVLELDPTDARGYYGKGMIELEEGNLDRGIENMEMALMWDSPGFERAYGCLAKAYRQRASLYRMFGEGGKALQDLKRIEALEVEQEQIASIVELKSEYH